MDPSYLLSDEAFARRIAIGLLHDRDAAEDLVQEAWERTLERPPPSVASPRGYLASLLRRLSFRRRRSAERRRARELAHPVREATGDAAALVARAEIHQRTVAAVLALEEPYRATVLRRFFEDLTIAEIAAHDGIPVETARTRLKRALAMLRARLEREGQDWRSEWAVALASGGSWPEPDAGAPRASLLDWALVAGLATTVVLVWHARTQGSADLLALDLPRTESGVLQEERSTELAPPSPATRTAAAAAAPEAPPVPSLRGRVTDEAGHALAGVHVQLGVTRFESTPLFAYAVTAPDGRFACSLAGWLELSPPMRALFGIQLEAWASGHAPLGRVLELGPDGLPGEQELVLAAGRILILRVLDAEGEPVELALVKVRARGHAAQPERWFSAESDRDGWAVAGLEQDERLTEVMLSSREHGFAYRAEAELPAQTSGDLELGALALQPGHALSGRIVHPDGTPVRRMPLNTRLVEPAPEGGFRPAQRPREEYTQGLTQVSAKTDDLGRFELQGLRAGQYQLECGSLKLGDGAVWSAGELGLEVVVPQHHLMIEVAGPDGRPIEEARIALTRLAADGAAAGEPQHALTRGRPPLAMWTVEPGQTWAVLTSVPGFEMVEERVAIPEVPHEANLRLALVPEDRSASLVLRPSAGSASAWRVTLCAPHSLAALPGLEDLVPDAEGRVRGLPCGDQRVRVDAFAADPSAPPEWCSAGGSTAVSLSKGTTPFEFQVLPAARLRLLFAGAGAAPASLEWDHAWQPERAVGGADSGAWMTAQLTRDRCRIELWSQAAGESRLVRALTGPTPAAGQFLELIAPAGPGRLRIARRGQAPDEHELDAAAGETVELTIPLDENPPPR